MCGIYGHLNFKGPVGVEASVLERATDLLSHRGPDARGSALRGQVYLGMRRLSIIDLEHGSQPIWNDTGEIGIVYNGELYNFRELRAELESKGHRFRTRSDTEVVLRAYEAWGAECLKRFNGMFAFAIWEKREERLLLARDRLGEKPLYWYRDAERVVFASEIKAILADRSLPRQIDRQGLLNYLTCGHSVAPRTIYSGIRKLLPGHYLVARKGEVSLTQYWDVGDEPQAGPDLDEEEWATALRRLLDDSVRMRMVADVPVGAFLSGGVDSSAVTALMVRHAQGPVKTFSLGFTAGGAYNELPEAAAVARALGTEHHELRVEDADLPATLRALVYHFDEPFGDPAAFPLHLLSRFAARQVKAVLSGDGGDELFGGYRRYAVDRFSPAYRWLPSVLKNGLPALAGRLPRLRRIKRALNTLRVAEPSVRYLSWLSVFSPQMCAELLAEPTPDCGEALSAIDRHYHGLRASAGDHLNRLMYADLKTLLVDGYLEKSDKATMACGLEARLPLLDHRLVELAFQIPARMKIRGRGMKRILKRAVRDLLPREVLTRRKHGFAVPLDPWFRGPLKAFTYEVLLDGRTRARGYFNTAFVERLWREHGEGRHVWDAPLWLLVNFELWHRIYLDGEAV